MNNTMIVYDYLDIQIDSDDIWYFVSYYILICSFSGRRSIQGVVSMLRCRLTNIGIPMLKIRRSHDRPIFNIEIPIPGKEFVPTHT